MIFMFPIKFYIGLHVVSFFSFWFKPSWFFWKDEVEMSKAN